MRGGGGLFAVLGTSLALGGTTLIVVAMAAHPHAPAMPVTHVALLPSTARWALGPAPSGRDQGPPPLAERGMSRSKPVAIDIPAVGVHSALLSLGLNGDGTVQVPSGATYDEAGWYRYSPTPGSIGPAVILGHVTGPGRESVFFRLGELRPGNRVTVSREDGSVAVFQIERIRRYPKKRFPTELVYGNTDRASIRLITCGGMFNLSTGHFLDNVIAFGILVDSK
jgi:hypothetical protein